MSNIRTLSDAIIDEYLGTMNRLKSSATIVLNPLFERTIVKLHGGNVSVLSREETISISRLVLQNNRPEFVAEEDGLSFAQRALRRQIY